jgi:hypothetical protein
MDLGAVQAMIETLIEEIKEVEDPPRTVKNGKPPAKKRKVVKAKDRLIPIPKLFRDKPVSGKLAYTLDYSRRGRVPNWVLKQAKCSDKAAVCKKFKDGHRFTA